MADTIPIPSGLCNGEQKITNGVQTVDRAFLFRMLQLDLSGSSALYSIS